MKKRATIQYWIVTALLVSVAFMSGCGGGGGGGVTTPVTPPAKTVVTGTASKGIIDPGGKVKLYAVDKVSGAKGALLATADIGQNGGYTADLGTYSGALILEVSGTYTDEATQTKVTIDPATPMRAVVDAVDNGSNNNRKVAVTPLTDLAYRLVGANFGAAQIQAANKQIGDLFKIDDIIATQPVAYNAATMGGANTFQQQYTMFLAALSKMTNPGAGVSASFAQITAMLGTFESDIKTGASLDPTRITAFSTALDAVTKDPGMSGFSAAVANLATVGATTLKVTMSVGAIPAGVQLGGLKATLALPAGVSIRADGTGQAQSSMIAATGALAGGTTLIAGNYQAAANSLTIGLISTAGFGAGDVLTITLDVKSGSTVTASNIPVTLNEAKDAGAGAGNVTGVTVALR